MSILKRWARDQNGSILNYLRYAISEIILVVLGILIAVSINNWNESRKNAEELNAIFLTVKDNLEKDLETVDVVTDYYKQRAPIYEAILNRRITAEQYIQKRMNAFLLLGFPEFAPHTSGFEQLKTYPKRIGDEADSLTKQILSFYTVRLVELEVDDVGRTKNFENDFNYLKENYDWWGTYLYERKLDGFLDYALNDPDYYNRISTSRFMNYDVYLMEVLVYRGRALGLLEAIDQYLGKVAE
jgi:hypothetical protein